MKTYIPVIELSQMGSSYTAEFTSLQEFWDIVHDAPGSGVAEAYRLFIVRAYSVPAWFQSMVLTRLVVFFNTGVLSGRTLSSANLEFYTPMGGGFYEYARGGLEPYPGALDIQLVEGVGHGSPAIAGDFGALLPHVTSFGSIGYTSILRTPSSWNSLAINASGLAAINKDGQTSFGMRFRNDVDDDPTGFAISAFGLSPYYVHVTDSDVAQTTNYVYPSIVGEVTFEGVFNGVSRMELEIEYAGVQVEYPRLYFEYWRHPDGAHLFTPYQYDKARGGTITATVAGLPGGVVYDYRLCVDTGLKTLYGETRWCRTYSLGHVIFLDTMPVRGAAQAYIFG